jgi:predicted methyltransferase
VPPNCSFVIDNAEDVWLYSPSQAFDLIHMRAMSGSIKDWPKLYSQAFQHLKPGGWVEAQDHDVKLGSDDDSVDRAKDWVHWMKTANEVAEKFGKILDVGPRQKQWMTDAGFVDIREQIFKV